MPKSVLALQVDTTSSVEIYEPRKNENAVVITTIFSDRAHTRFVSIICYNLCKTLVAVIYYRLFSRIPVIFTLETRNVYTQRRNKHRGRRASTTIPVATWIYSDNCRLSLFITMEYVSRLRCKNSA